MIKASSYDYTSALRKHRIAYDWSREKLIEQLIEINKFLSDCNNINFVSLGQLHQYHEALFLRNSYELILKNFSNKNSLKNSRILYYFVDHTIACSTNTGVQRVTRYMAKALQNIGQRIEYVKWDENTSQFVLVDIDELNFLARWQGPVVAKSDLNIYKKHNEDSLAITKDRIPPNSWLVVPEVTHITNHTSAVTLDIIVKAKQLNLQTVFIFYDAIPLQRSELKGMSGLHEQYMQHLLLADLILPISKWSSLDLIDYYHVHEKAEPVFSPLIKVMSLPSESDVIESRTSNAREPSATQTILAVGSIVPHKNQIALVRAFDKLCKTHTKITFKLLLIGNLHPDLSSELISITRSNANIEYLGNIPDEDLSAHYANCAFTVFPSLMEGFGLPILESLAFGKPVVCANFGAMAEVAEGGGCLSIDTSDETALLVALKNLIDDPGLLAKLTTEAKRRPSRTWKDYADEFIQQINDLSNPCHLVGSVYYWIDHTCTYHSNSGIQRVTRGLACSLLNHGISLIPTKWDEENECFYPASTSDLEHFAKWNGPAADRWSRWVKPESAGNRDWVLIPELTHYLQRTSVEDIKKYTKTLKLRCAWIFHDAIPWKLKEFYSQEESKTHEKYMLCLNNFEKVFPTSKHTENDFLTFIGSRDIRVGNIEDRVTKCMLPGEFSGSQRIVEYPKCLPSSITILCVGTVEPRKNHLVLLDAYLKVQEMSSIPMQLIILGGAPNSDLAIKIQEILDLNSTIVWKKKADDLELRDLYIQSSFTVYPSVEEGFGMPILESLWHGRPCICANYGAMAEIAEDGGCLTVDTRDSSELAGAIFKLATDERILNKLGHQATTRAFKTWDEYGLEIIQQIAYERFILVEPKLKITNRSKDDFYKAMINLDRRPLLSICISTYNRARWLALNLQNLMNIVPEPLSDVEIVIVDNASTDNTADVVKVFTDRSDFSYHRNVKNVGMLGNLRVTANAARGEYVWILGDDDLLMPHAVTNIIQAIKSNPNVALIYLNYAYTKIDNADEVTDIENFVRESLPITPSSENLAGTIRQLCTQSENFFTAIYCLVFRRDHAIKAYSQNTEGRPFSTMLTSVPTTYYVLNHLMDELAYWIGEPQLVVNLNVSWMKYAPLWILERVPEFHDLAEKLGADSQLVDKWRINNMPGIKHFFEEIFTKDPEENYKYISISRLINRLKHLQDFKQIVPDLRKIYETMHHQRHPLAKDSPEVIFSFAD